MLEEISKYIESGIPRFYKHFTTFEQLLGGVGDDVKQRPLDPTAIEYKQIMLRELKRGSLVRMVLLLMLPVLRNHKLIKYLKSDPNYKPSPLTNHMLLMDFDITNQLNLLKSVIDLNLANLSAPEQSELIQLTKDTLELNDKYYLPTSPAPTERPISADPTEWQRIIKTTEPNVKQLSDRVFEPLADFTAKMFASDFVQKLLMNAEMINENIRIGRIFLKRVKARLPTRLELLKQSLSVATDDQSRQILDGVIKYLVPIDEQFVAKIEQQLGGGGNDANLQAMDETEIEFQQLIHRELKRGSLVRMMLLEMLLIWRNQQLRKYLNTQPRYQPRPLSDLMLFKDFDDKLLMNAYNSIIRLNSANISPADERELTQLAREVMVLFDKMYVTYRPTSPVPTDASNSINPSSQHIKDLMSETFQKSMMTFVNTDYVQRILMKGEMSDENIRLARIYLKIFKDSITIRQQLLKKTLSVATDSKTRQILDEISRNVEINVPKMDTHFTKFEQLLGGVGDDVKQRPLDPTTVEYKHLVDREVKRGSLVRMVLLLMLPVLHNQKLIEYLKSKPSYRPSPLTNHMLLTDVDKTNQLNLLKSVIDLNIGKLSAPEQSELIQLTKEMLDLHDKCTYHTSPEEPTSADSTEWQRIISTEPKVTQISDRLFEPFTDSVTKTFASDYVQKILMTGEMTDENIRIGRIFLKNIKNSITSRFQLLKYIRSITTDDKSRKILDGIIGYLGPKNEQFLTKFEQKLGAVGDDVKQQLINETNIETQQLIQREMKHGSLVRKVLVLMMPISRTLQIQEYLKKQPRYQSSPLSDLMLFKEFDLKTLLNAYKNVIYLNAVNITAPIESELMTFVKDVSKFKNPLISPDTKNEPATNSGPNDRPFGPTSTIRPFSPVFIDSPNGHNISPVTTDLPISNSLTVRLLETVEHSLAKLFASDYVQKIVMMADMSKQFTMRLGRIFWWRIKKLFQTRVEMLKGAQTLVTIDTDCKYLEQITNRLINESQIVLATNKQILGDINDVIQETALSEITLDYQLLVYREMRRRSLIRMLVTDLVPVWRILQLREYVKRQPQYRPSALSRFLLYSDIELDTLFKFYKKMIDSLLPNITPTEMQELIQLIKESIDIDLKFISVPIESLSSLACNNKTLTTSSTEKKYLLSNVHYSHSLIPTNEQPKASYRFTTDMKEVPSDNKEMSVVAEYRLISPFTTGWSKTINALVKQM
ncbi:unnamed protein product, partial [Medioppia subpectinata]